MANQSTWSQITNPINQATATKRDFVIFREITYDKTIDDFIFGRRDGRVKWDNLKKLGFLSIEDLLKRISDYKKLPITPIDPGLKEVHYLDIAVCSPSDVIISIKSEDDWFFSSDKDSKNCSVSLGEIIQSGYDKKFFNVLHVDPKDNSVSNVVPANCKLIAFSADPLTQPPPPQPSPPGSNDQPYNYHLVDSAGKPRKVDPDIRYPGNTGLEPGDDPPFPVVWPPVQP